MSTKTAPRSANEKKKRADSGLRVGRWTPTLFVLPAVILLFVITIVPFIIELILSLHAYELTSLGGPQFVWLKNYADVLLGDTRFWSAMKTTVIVIIAAVGIELVLGVFLALLLNRLRSSRSLITSLLLIPVMIAPIVSGMMWDMIYDDKFGPLNYLIETLSFGLLEGTAWLAQTATALPSVIAVDVWQWTPFVVLILLSGLRAIPEELYEAATVDGAGRLQAFAHVTWPLLAWPVMIVLLIRSMDAFKVFDVVYGLTFGGPGNSTTVASFYIYKQGFSQFLLGYAAALSWIVFIIVYLISFLIIRFLKPAEEES